MIVSEQQTRWGASDTQMYDWLIPHLFILLLSLMKQIYENCLRKVMILKAKRRLGQSSQEENELIQQLDLFLTDCDNG